MSPVRDLATLLASACPRMSDKRFSIDCATKGPPPGTEGVFALIREDEGLTVIREDAQGPWALISMTVHSDLEAVGFTAAFARTLTESNLPANVVAGYHHDHLFVPWARRHEALEALGSLSGDQA